MYKYIDALMTLLPQEPKYFTPYHLETTFVGHPVIESEVLHADGEAFRAKYGIPADKKVIAVLPGSRHNEVAKLLPVFLEASKMLLKYDKDFFFVIPTVKTVAKRVREMTQNCGLPLQVVETQQDRYNAFRASSAAIAASGTVALELAITRIPHIIAYKVSPLTAFIVGRIMKIQFVNLSNIMLGREIIPELLQERCVCGNICQYVLELLKHGDLYERQMEGFDKVKEILSQGRQTPSENASDVVLELIARRNRQ